MDSRDGTTAASLPWRTSPTSASITICVLDTVSISVVDREPVKIGSMQQKVVLTLLVAYGHRSVSLDRIAEELWGEHRPHRWLASIRTLANNLRRVAGDRNLVYWTGRGYRLHKDAGAVDTDIDWLVAATDEARFALGDGRLDDAEAAARRALGYYGSGPWTTDWWHWADLAADAYCLLGRALLEKANYLRCLLELSRAPEEFEAHHGVGACLERARRALAVANH